MTHSGNKIEITPLQLVGEIQRKYLTRMSGNDMEVRINCPFCHMRQVYKSLDVNFHMYINTHNGLFYCFRCGMKGHVNFLLNGVASTHNLIINSGEEIAQTKYNKLEELPEYTEDLRSLEATHPANIYLRKRGIEPNEWPQIKFLYCRRGKYYQRIVIPIEMKDEYRGFQARSILESGVLETQNTPKYLTGCGTSTKKTLFNFDTARMQKHIVIVEGIFDVLKVGPSAVAMFGKTIGQEQLNLLKETGKDVVVMVDSDAQPEAAEIAQKCMKFTNVKIATPKTDPGNHSKEENAKLIGSALTLMEFMLSPILNS